MKNLVLLWVVATSSAMSITLPAKAAKSEIAALSQDGAARLDSGVMAIAAGLSLLLALAAKGGSSDEAAAPVELSLSGEPLVPMDGFITIEDEQDRLATLRAAQDVQVNSLITKTGADHGIAIGYSGKGVKIGLADDGIDLSKSNVAGITVADQYNPLGLDYAAAGSTRHANIMAQIIAAPSYDQNKVRGIAPDVVLYDIQAFGNSVNGGAYQPFFGGDIASGMKYVVDHKLDIVNGSLYYIGPSLNDFMAQNMNGGYMSQAIDNGTIFVFANGNEGTATTTSLPVIAGGDAAFKGQLISVAALDHAGKTIASYATHCGEAMQYCLAAPGQYYYLNNDGDIVSTTGSSVATAGVSGILALLKEQFPEMSPAQLVDLVLSTADDLGAPGTDKVYGRGAINVSRAFAPQGVLQVALGEDVERTVSLGSTVIVTDSTMARTLAATLGDAEMVVLDDYARGYYVSLGELVTTGQGLHNSPLSPNSIGISSQNHQLTAFEDGSAVLSQAGLFRLGYGNTGLVQAQNLTALTRGYGPLDWLEDSLSLSLDAAPFSLGASYAPDGASQAIWAGLGYDTLDWGLGLNLGHIWQKDAFGTLALGSGQGQTAFAQLSARAGLAADWALHADLSLAHSDFSGGNWLKAAQMSSSAMRVSLWHEWHYGQTILSLGTPLVPHEGYLDLDLAAARASHDDDGPAISRITQRRGLKSTRAIDIGLHHVIETRSGAQISLKAALRDDQGDRKAYGAIGYQMRF